MVTNVSHNPQDLTGRRKAELAEKYAEEQKNAAKHMALVSAQADEEKDGEVDLSGPDSIIVADVEVKVKKKVLRVNTPIENMTLGHGTDFTFVPGQKYKVDEHVYDHLDELGYVWH